VKKYRPHHIVSNPSEVDPPSSSSGGGDNKSGSGEGSTGHAATPLKSHHKASKASKKSKSPQTTPEEPEGGEPVNAYGKKADSGNNVSWSGSS
jgi:hypothetical protein